MARKCRFGFYPQHLKKCPVCLCSISLTPWLERTWVGSAGKSPQFSMSWETSCLGWEGKLEQGPNYSGKKSGTPLW